MATANPLWGAPRIHGELQKLGIAVSQSTVAKYMPRRETPPSQTWWTFLANHVGQIMAADFIVVPPSRTDSCSCSSSSRTPVDGSSTWPSPTIPPAWTAQQLRNAFPDDLAPRYLLHDCDAAFTDVASTIAAMQINEVVTAPRSPWQTTATIASQPSSQPAAPPTSLRLDVFGRLPI